MLDYDLFKKYPQKVKDMLYDRNLPDLVNKVDELVSIDREWREIIIRTNELRSEKNKIGKRIGDLKKNGDSIDEELKNREIIAKELDSAESQLKEYDAKRSSLIRIFPNLLDESVPRGANEEDNKPIKWVGTPRLWRGYLDSFLKKNPGFNLKYEIVEELPKHHADLVIDYNLADVLIAAQTSGSRFFYETNELVELDMALSMYAFKKIRSSGDFRAIAPPYLVRRSVEDGATDMSVFEEVLYKIEGEDLYLIPTSEHPIAAFASQLDINESDLPLRFVGISPCFRKEAGSHGKDTRGIFRVHQFNKVEEYAITTPEKSYEELDFLLDLSESIIKDLEIPYRVVFLSSADTDKKATKQFDIEGWFPGQGKYRELTSTGNVTDWQARRLGIKYRDKKNHKKQYAHTVYSTGVAVQRLMTCILENKICEDRSIDMPRVLWPYLSFERIYPK